MILVIIGLWCVFLGFSLYRYIVFYNGYFTLQQVAAEYSIIKKVIAIKSFQEDLMKASSDEKKKVVELHKNNLEEVENLSSYKIVESILGYEPTKKNIFLSFTEFVFSMNRKFNLSEERYYKLENLYNFVQENKEYLDFEIIKNEKTEA